MFRLPSYTVRQVLLHVPWSMIAIPGMAVVEQVHSTPVLRWTTFLRLRVMFGRKLGMLMSASSGTPNVP